MRHISNTPLTVVNALDNSLGQLLDHVGKLVFFGRGIARSSARLGGRGDTSIGVECAD
jgi:hypothetical protein